MAGGQGVVFGEGLRCAGGQVVRLAIKPSVAGTSHYPNVGDPSIAVRGMVPPGAGTRSYPVWYRNLAGPCGSAAFNLSNAARARWGP